MQVKDMIAKKRDGGSLSTEEISYLIKEYTAGNVPDYQMSSMLMAIVWRGMDSREIHDLTMSMMHSGDVIDLSSIEGVKADKHSTGGVGDKTSLALLPMIAVQGLSMAKMSGRGLGHTGGTLDKLESFEGYSSEMTQEQFLTSVRERGFTIAGQSANLVPADKKLYALRDVTGTVPAIPLIVSSIMSKKLAAGADVIVLDVKCGSGSFMKDMDEATKLAESMVEVGKLAGKKTVACITDMDEPLGNTVGNALEVKEAIALLNGEYGGKLLELCLTLGSCILVESGKFETDIEARTALLKSIEDKTALDKFAEYIKVQGGDERAVYDTSLLPQAKVIVEAYSDAEGFVSHINSEDVGVLVMHLGGGRSTKESVIDLAVGLELHKKVGDYVKVGDSLATVHAASEQKATEAIAALKACYTLAEDKPVEQSFIKAIVR